MKRIRVTLESQRVAPREPLYQRWHRARILQEARQFAALNMLN